MKSTIISVVIAVILIGGVILIGKNSDKNSVSDTVPAHNVSIVDGKQIIEIRVKGGYQPKTSIAKAGIPTIVRFDTSGTFDCSSSIRIPALGVSKILPQSGTTDIDIGVATLGTLSGTCSMGMYSFEISFQN